MTIKNTERNTDQKNVGNVVVFSLQTTFSSNIQQRVRTIAFGTDGWMVGYDLLKHKNETPCVSICACIFLVTKWVKQQEQHQQ